MSGSPIPVTGQHTDTPTRGLPTRGLDDSWTGHLADWSTRGLDNSRTGQVADWTTHGCHRRFCVLSFRSFGGICETASCPVRELTSARVVQSASWQSASWCIHELSSYPYPHPITNTKLTLILTLTLIPTLTLLTLLNCNCNSKMTKLTSFRRTSQQNDPDDAILANALHRGLLQAISLH